MKIDYETSNNNNNTSCVIKKKNRKKKSKENTHRIERPEPSRYEAQINGLNVKTYKYENLLHDRM